MTFSPKKFLSFNSTLITLDNLEREISKITETPEEKEEIWQIIDEMVHHRVLGCILDRLPKEHHHQFLSLFYECPYDEKILQFIEELVEDDIEDLIKKETKVFSQEILQEIFRKG